jgi:hypothetical protein
MGCERLAPQIGFRLGPAGREWRASLSLAKTVGRSRLLASRARRTDRPATGVVNDFESKPIVERMESRSEVGMKSYGRPSTFLKLTVYEQVRSIAATLAGDMEATAQVELVFSETGVCEVDARQLVAGLADAPRGRYFLPSIAYR